MTKIEKLSEAIFLKMEQDYYAIHQQYELAAEKRRHLRLFLIDLRIPRYNKNITIDSSLKYQLREEKIKQLLK